MAGHRDDLSGCDIEQDGAGFRQLVDRLDPPIGDDLAAEGTEVGSQAVGDPLRTAADDRPADGVAGDAEHQPDRGRRPRFQWEDRVGGQAGEQGAGLGCGEPTIGQHRCGLDGLETESRGRDRVRRQSERSEQFGEEAVGVRGEWFHQPSIGSLVRPERSGGLLDRPLEHGRRAVVERVGQRRRGVDQFQAMLGQGEGLEERGCHRERMHRRADVVKETGKRQRCRAGTAANRGCCFDDEDRETFARSAIAAESPLGPDPTTTPS